MKKKNEKYFVGIGIALVMVMSILFGINRSPRITYTSNNKENYEVVENDFTPSTSEEIVLGDISASNRQVKVKEYIVSEQVLAENYQCNGCLSSTEGEKNSDGTYKSSSCAGKNPCYFNRYATYSTVGRVSYKITTGNWLMSDGDSKACEASCSLSAGSSSSTCTISGACPTTILGSSGSKKYVTSVSVDGTVLDTGTVNVEYCSPTWSDGTTTKFFRTIWDRDYAIVHKEKVYMDSCTIVNQSCNNGNCTPTLYKCGPGEWHVRCGGNPPAVPVCVYTPSGIGDNSFKYANAYKMTDSPTEEELNYVAYDKDASTCKGCFGNTPTFARATNTSWSTGPSSATPYKYDERTTEASCTPLPEPRVCAPQDYSDGKVQEETDKCEEEKSIFFEDGKKCVGSVNDAFYEIKCVNKVANYFDLNKDGVEVETLNIKQGQSFAYEIESISTKMCYAVFNAEVWERAYNRIQTKFQALQNESVRVTEVEKASAIQWYITVQTKIFNQVNDYLNWKPAIENEPTAKVTLKQGDVLQPLNNPKGVSGSSANKIVELIIDDERTKDPSFDRKATDDGNIASIYYQNKNDLEKDRNGNHIMVKDSNGSKKAIDIAKDYGIEVTSVENQPKFDVNLNNGLYVRDSMPSSGINLNAVKNFLWITTSKKELYMMPPKVTLNWIDGAIVLNSSDASIAKDGYNRIYTSQDIAKNKVYNLNVTLENLGGNKSVVLDNKCKLKVSNTELIYRVIEEKNPFINDTRQKGYNWYRTGIDGTVYDFTNIIPNSNEYNVLYSLSPDDIKVIKKSNEKLKDAYLGTCYLSETNEASEILCK